MGLSDKLLRCLIVCRIKGSCICHICKCSDCQSDCTKDNQSGLTPQNSTQEISTKNKV